MDAWIGLGANLGDRRATLAAAFDALAALPATRSLVRSRTWSSAPLGADGPDYLNAVARIDVDLAPLELLEALQRIEARYGRVRPHANAPRTLDLDLLLAGDARLALPAADGHPALVVPHPRLHERAFVLRPMAEIDPDVVVPGLGPVRQWLPTVAAQRCDPVNDAR